MFGKLHFTLTVFLLLTSIAFGQQAQQDAQPAAVPHVIRYTGVADATPGQTLTLKFTLYENQTGGDPVWTESQQVTPDATGKYSVLLGAATENGLPQNVFSAAQAKWLGITTGDGQELARTILVATPYSLKASDSETLGGHPASDFTLKSALPASGTDVTQINVTNGVTGGGTGPTVTLGLSSSYLETLGNGIYPQLAGTNTLTGTNNFTAGKLVVSGSPALSVANVSASSPITVAASGSTVKIGLSDSALLTLGDGVYAQLAAANTFTKPITFAAGQTFPGTVSLSGSNTFTGSNTFSKTITFASGQTFPGTGTGTITGITTASPLSGSGTSGSVALSLNTSALESTLNAIYPSLSGNDTFSGTNTFSGSSNFNNVVTISGSASGGQLAVTNSSIVSLAPAIEATGNASSGSGLYAQGSLGIQAVGDGDGGVGLIAAGGQGIFGVGVSGQGYVGVNGYGSSTGTGTPGSSGVGVQGSGAVGVYGNSTYSGNGQSAIGVYGLIPGSSMATGTVGVWGEADGGEETTGVYGSGQYGVMGSSTYVFGAGVSGLGPATGVLGQTNGGGGGSYGTGVYGGNANTGSFEGSVFGATSSAGVWGDFPDGYGPGSGVLATADTLTALIAVNNSPYPSMEVYNYTSATHNPVFETYSPNTYSGARHCTIDTSANLTCTGVVSSVVHEDAGTAKAIYSVSSADNWVEDAGGGQLSAGHADVALDPAFAGTVNTGVDYHVFLTPKGDCKGLYVANETSSGFEVRELGGGTSSIAFDYRIMAKRKGYESVRLEDLTAREAADNARMAERADRGANAKPIVRRVVQAPKKPGLPMAVPPRRMQPDLRQPATPTRATQPIASQK